MTTIDTSGMESDQDAMNRLCWNEGRAYNYTEEPEPLVPASGCVTLAHDAAPVPRQGDNGEDGGNGITRRNGATEFSLSRRIDLRFSVAPCKPVSSAASVTSQDQHRIAVAVEPVPPLHGISIDGEDLLAARKRRREDQQRRLRQMEIGDEGRHQVEAMTGTNEQTRFTFAGPHGPLVNSQ